MRLTEITKQEFKDTLKNPLRVLILKTIEAMNEKLTDIGTLQAYEFNEEHETHIVTVTYDNSEHTSIDLKLIFNSYFPRDKFNTETISETPRFNNHMAETTLYVMEH